MPRVTITLLWIAVALGAPGLLAQCAVAADEETKFFRVAEVEGAWWFIAPGGSRLFSSGVNVVDVGGTRNDYDSQRPQYAAFRHYPSTAAWAEATQRRLHAWGFNTVGGWSAREMTTGPLPYTAVLHFGKELGVPWVDMLHPRFTEQVAAIAEEKVAPWADDSRLIGWYTDNELAWFADTLFAFHIAQPAESVTRQALVTLLREQYRGDFARLKLDFVARNADNFGELEAGGKLLFRPGGHGVKVADDFLRMIAARFYQTAQAAIRRYDANHLILGDRYHGYCPDAVAEAAGPYVDVISTNFDQPDWTDGRLPNFYLERLHRLSGRPVLITEYYAAAHDNRSGNKNTGNIFTTVATQQERAEALCTRLSCFASLPYVVGAHWFQFSDEPMHGRPDGEDYNFGLVDIEDRPYEELVAAFTKANAEVPRLHATAGLTRSKKNPEPLAVPAAPTDPLAGIAAWDQERAIVSSEEASSLGDLLVSWGPDRMYVALACNSFVDRAAYADQRPGEGEQMIWQIALDGEAPLVVQFGTGDKFSVSDPRADIRVHQHGLRYTVIAGLPKQQLDAEPWRKGSGLRLAASLEDPRRGARTTWKTQLECDGRLREAQSRAEARPH